GIHVGAIFPYRHPGYFPLYGTTFLVVEWLLTLLGAGLLLTSYRRPGALLAAVGIAMSLSQMLQNQKILLLLILLVVAIAKPEDSPEARWFLRWQLVLVYGFTALAKIFAEFSTGATLAKISPIALNESVFLVLSWFVIALELMIPFCLFKKRQWAWFAIAILHGSFTIFMRDIAAFTLGMFALAALYYSDSSWSSKRMIKSS
ncbi:MAG: hypothetical protein J7501_15460, partial [Bdellovibrio sp.]|nr:hypothetical protein [Bdellovibrio sp.]